MPVMLNGYTGIVPETGSQAEPEPIMDTRWHMANRLVKRSAVRRTLSQKLRSNSRNDRWNLEGNDLALGRSSDGKGGLGDDIDGSREGGRDPISELDGALRMDAGERIDGLMTDRAAFPLVIQDRPMAIARIERHRCCSGC
jgi:hypothetical protein